MLNLRVLSPNGIKSSIIVSSSECLGELKRLCCESCKIPNSDAVDLLWGFPPRIINLSDNDILNNNIENNETIRVQFKENSGLKQVQTPIAKGKKKKEVTSNNNNSSSSSSSSTFGARIASISNGKVVLEKRPSDNTSKNNNKRQKTNESYWNKLINKTMKEDNSSNGGKRVKKTVRSSAGSEGDITEHLVAAATGDVSTRSKNFRKTFKHAMELNYAWTLSVQRLASLYSGHYTIEESQNSRVLGSGDSTVLKIKFQKGPSGTSYHEEEVNLVPKPILKTMLQYALNDEEGNGRELLKPSNMARATKQIFWSIVKHYGPDIPVALKTIFPDIKDWNWLRERTRELSEKAKRNLQQKQELAEAKAARMKAKGKKNDSNDMAHVNDMSNIHNEISNTNGSNNNLMNPELLHAIKSCGSIDAIVPDEWINKVLIVIGAPDTDTDADTGSDTKNHVFLLSRYDEFSNKEKAEKSADIRMVEALRQLDDEKGGEIAPTPDQCDSWIESAQRIVVMKFWSLACGDSYRLWYTLRNRLLVVSPIQMKLWMKHPDGLYDALVESDPQLNTTSLKNPFYRPSSSSSSSSAAAASYFVSDDPPGSAHMFSKEPSSSLSSSFFITDDPVVFLRKPSSSSSSSSSSLPSTSSALVPIENREYVLFGREWVKWMCAISEQFLAINWVDNYDGTLDDEDDEDTSEDNDNNNEDNGNKNNDDDDDEWLYDPADSKYINRRVRISNYRQNFFIEGIVIGYLPATADEPMALWKARLDNLKKKGNGNISANTTTTNNSNVEYQDLEENELFASLM